MSPVTHRPADEYKLRVAARRATLEALNRRDAATSYWRLVVFAAFVLFAVLAWRDLLHPAFIALPIVAFVWLVKSHERTLRARDTAEQAVSFYEKGLARIEDRWIGAGEHGERFRDDHHLYANDLDLFGPASLFELLSIARTQAGEETLAHWLKTPASRDDIRARQDAIRELTSGLDLREDLALAGAGMRAAVHSGALTGWAERPYALTPPFLRWVAVALTITAIGSLLPLTVGIWQPLVVVFVVQRLFRGSLGTQIEAVLHSATGYVRELSILREALARFERERFSSATLAALHAQIDAPHAPASRVIRRLERLVEAHDWEHNMVFAVPAALLLWSTHLAWAIETWRRRHGRDVGIWLRAVGELEALSSLATYAYEHPGDPFPTIRHDDRPGTVAVLEGTALGHPLLPAARMVRNDMRLDEQRRLLVISGSNMSGKSTVLRTVGINVVLALAGAPVRATALTVSPLAIGATLRIQDSLTDGRSRFYAEITRVREIVDLARSGPLLFLLDELFHGTNSHDRFIGATGVLRSLMDLGAIGMITTHDMALTGIATELAPRAENVHFEDELIAGKMRFDYRMKPGPVTHSNALALMRAVGLDVP
jgi:hypothetical protein